MNKIVLTEIKNVTSSYYFPDKIRKINIDIEYEVDCDFILPRDCLYLSVLVLKNSADKILLIDVCSSIDIYTDITKISEEQMKEIKTKIADHLKYLIENKLETKDYDN